MSIISSSTNKVSNAVQSAAHEVSQKAEQAVEQLTPKLPTQVIADRFENAPRLYDAGVHHPNRTTVDRISVHGKSFDFRSQGSDGSRLEQHGVTGVKGHAFAQRAQSVVSAGLDGFAGVKQSETEVNAHGDSHSVSMKLGVEGSASAFAGSVNGVKAGVKAGFEFTEKNVTRTDLGDGKELKHESTVAGMWGGVAQAGAQLGTVTGANVDLLAGARGGGESRWAVVDGKDETFGVAGRGMAMIGIGLKADVEAGYDMDRHQLRASGGAGAALGIGGYVGGEVTVGGPDESPRREVELGRAVDFVRGRIAG